MEEKRQVIEWLGLRLSVPAEWEIVRHSVRQEAGSLMLVDRRFQRLQLTWTRCDRRPDTGRIFADFRARDKEEHPDCVLTPLSHVRKWSVYRRTVDGKCTTRAGLFDQKARRWIDAVLVWPEGLDEKEEAALLGGFAAADPADSRCRWRAFHLSIESPAEWKLVKAEIKPADASLTFESNGGACTVRRIGMPDLWFDGDAEAYLRKETTPTSRGSFGIAMRGRHENAWFRGKEKMFHPRWLWGRRRRRSDRAWLCPAAHAFYHVSATTFPSASMPLEEFSVDCCGVRETSS